MITELLCGEVVPRLFEVLGGEGGLGGEAVVQLLVVLGVVIVRPCLVDELLLVLCLLLLLLLQLLWLYQPQLFVSHGLEVLVVLDELGLFLLVHYSQSVEVLLGVDFVQPLFLTHHVRVDGQQALLYLLWVVLQCPVVKGGVVYQQYGGLVVVEYQLKHPA